MDVQKSSLLKLEQIELPIIAAKKFLILKTAAYLLQSNSMCLCFPYCSFSCSVSYTGLKFSFSLARLGSLAQVLRKALPEEPV